MRNSLGQKIEVGTPVVMITQDNDVKVGRVYMFNSSDYPRIEWLDGKKSPPIVKWFRLIVISDDDFDTFKAVRQIRLDAQRGFRANNARPSMPGPGNRQAWDQYRLDQNAYSKAEQQHIDNMLLAKGYEPYYAG